MYWDFSEMTDFFSDGGKHKLLTQGNFGIELESQRITPSGDLALTPHPSVFGNKSENTRITTDFSESQIEMITPPYDTAEAVYRSLKEIRAEVASAIDGELLWPMSMPPRLPQEELIPIAKFPESKEAHEKEIYRKGLTLRYGKKMQMISGIHYNFSLSEQMLEILYARCGKEISKREFTDGLYLALTRNFLRYRWLPIYLFGASPLCDETYYPVICKELKAIERVVPRCGDSVEKIGKSAVSLRVSRFGYSNTLQNRYKIYFNSMQEYASTMHQMLATSNADYLNLGLFKDGEQVQLNGNILQKESEFYSSIRLKQNIGKGETQLDALMQRGIKYIEVRILDIDPFEPVGVSLSQLDFMQVFLLYCLFEHSADITAKELEKINANHHLTALYGRKKGLKLHLYENGSIPLKNFAQKIFERLYRIADLMDQGSGGQKYRQSVARQDQKITDISLLPSEKIFREIKDKDQGYLAFGIKQAKQNMSAASKEADA